MTQISRMAGLTASAFNTTGSEYSSSPVRSAYYYAKLAVCRDDV